MKRITAIMFFSIEHSSIFRQHLKQRHLSQEKQYAQAKQRGVVPKVILMVLISGDSGRVTVVQHN